MCIYILMFGFGRKQNVRSVSRQATGDAETLDVYKRRRCQAPASHPHFSYYQASVIVPPIFSFLCMYSILYMYALYTFFDLLERYRICVYSLSNIQKRRNMCMQRNRKNSCKFSQFVGEIFSNSNSHPFYNIINNSAVTYP